MKKMKLSSENEEDIKKKDLQWIQKLKEPFSVTIVDQDQRNRIVWQVEILKQALYQKIH